MPSPDFNIPTTIIYKREDGTEEVYVRQELLGRGGFSVVYRVKTQATNKIYAMKIIPKNFAISKNKMALTELKNEIKIQKSIKHPNIVRLEASFSDDTFYYIVLEYCPGMSIRRYLQKNSKGYLSEAETRKILRDVVRGLTYLHSSNIIHHDIKLENFIIGIKGRVKIADFGLAILLKNDDEKHYSVSGTTNYLSPEIVRRKGHSYEADIWATGVAAFTMLTGKAPFSAKSKAEIYEKILDCDFQFPSNIKLSADAKKFISSILQIDPTKRPTAFDLYNHPFLTKIDNEKVELYNPLKAIQERIQSARKLQSLANLEQPMLVQPPEKNEEPKISQASDIVDQISSQSTQKVDLSKSTKSSQEADTAKSSQKADQLISPKQENQRPKSSQSSTKIESKSSQKVDQLIVSPKGDKRSKSSQSSTKVDSKQSKKDEHEKSAKLHRKEKSKKEKIAQKDVKNKGKNEPQKSKKHSQKEEKAKVPQSSQNDETPKSTRFTEILNDGQLEKSSLNKENSQKEEKTNKNSQKEEKTTNTSQKEEKTNKTSQKEEKTTNTSQKEEKTTNTSQKEEKTNKNSQKEEKTNKTSQKEEKTAKTSRKNERTKTSHNKETKQKTEAVKSESADSLFTKDNKKETSKKDDATENSAKEIKSSADESVKSSQNDKSSMNSNQADEKSKTTKFSEKIERMKSSQFSKRNDPYRLTQLSLKEERIKALIDDEILKLTQRNENSKETFSRPSQKVEKIKTTQNDENLIKTTHKNELAKNSSQKVENLKFAQYNDASKYKNSHQKVELSKSAQISPRFQNTRYTNNDYQNLNSLTQYNSKNRFMNQKSTISYENENFQYGINQNNDLYYIRKNPYY